MIKTISVKERKILNHLEAQENVSQYVCSLIKQDMTANKKTTVIIKYILKMLDELEELD